MRGFALSSQANAWSESNKLCFLVIHQRAFNIGWQPGVAASVSVPGVQQAIITASRRAVYQDEYSSSDTE